MNCVACGSLATLRGRVGEHGHGAHFVPHGLKFFAPSRSLDLPGGGFHACTQCGHVWTECDATRLRALIDTSATEALLDELRARANPLHVRQLDTSAGPLVPCPACHDPVTVRGAVGAEFPEEFHPEGMRLITWTRSMTLNHLAGPVLLRACTSCGHVWGALHAGMLRRLVDASGTQSLRERMRRLGMQLP
jgi:hypothetical protein